MTCKVGYQEFNVICQKCYGAWVLRKILSKVIRTRNNVIEVRYENIHNML